MNSLNPNLLKMLSHHYIKQISLVMVQLMYSPLDQDVVVVVTEVEEEEEVVEEVVIEEAEVVAVDTEIMIEEVVVDTTMTSHVTTVIKRVILVEIVQTMRDKTEVVVAVVATEVAAVVVAVDTTAVEVMTEHATTVERPVIYLMIAHKKAQAAVVVVEEDLIMEVIEMAVETIEEMMTEKRTIDHYPRLGEKNLKGVYFM